MEEIDFDLSIVYNGKRKKTKKLSEKEQLSQLVSDKNKESPSRIVTFLTVKLE